MIPLGRKQAASAIYYFQRLSNLSLRLLLEVSIRHLCVKPTSLNESLVIFILRLYGIYYQSYRIATFGAALLAVELAVKIVGRS